MIAFTSGFTIQVQTALLPGDIDMPLDILSEFLPNYTVETCDTYNFVNINEYYRTGLALNKCKYINNENLCPWILGNLNGNWSITFHTREPVWVAPVTTDLLEYLREQSTNYDLIYQRDNINIFRLHVSKFIDDSGWWRIRISDEWYNECAICVSNAFLIRWSTCTHSFCRDCIDRWHEHSNTRPLCRTIAN